ncbi:MAG: hypothetical protein A2901_06745 [Elusimicrobia bacterium RIFCSPLOWO2_01_FULL_54_10]|nr:MAG: hypothetical protein A2901_06745 [Elusimicrobia bacterium RIFCSPLOWO2_01_FULL_54_10]
MNESDVSDDLLISAAKAGETSAFGQLMEKYRPALHAMILRHLRHREETEDVLQQVFLQAYQHLDGFRAEAKFYTWIYAIALNHVRNHVRQRKSWRIVSMDEMNARDQDMKHQWPDHRPTPEETVYHRMEIQAVQKALESLKDESRAIFIMHYFQYVPLDEVAARLQKPLGTVKVYLHRARKAVRECLENQAEVVT